MNTITLHEAQQQLAQIIADIKRTGRPLIIADNGEALVQISPVNPAAKPRQMGTLRGKIRVPDNFDRMADDAIAALFQGKENP